VNQEASTWCTTSRSQSGQAAGSCSISRSVNARPASCLDPLELGTVVDAEHLDDLEVRGPQLVPELVGGELLGVEGVHGHVATGGERQPVRRRDDDRPAGSRDAPQGAQVPGDVVEVLDDLEGDGEVDLVVLEGQGHQLGHVRLDPGSFAA
jgi:hypothetical protein